MIDFPWNYQSTNIFTEWFHRVIKSTSTVCILEIEVPGLGQTFNAYKLQKTLGIENQSDGSPLWYIVNPSAPELDHPWIYL